MATLEAAIIKGVETAQKKYESWTGAWWLGHGAESFLQHEVAASIYKAGFFVYPEASPKKLIKDFDDKVRGRPMSRGGQRIDVAIWFKTKNQIKALLEIKRVTGKDPESGLQPVIGDVRKLNKILKTRVFASGIGYVLVYAEASGPKRKQILEERWDGYKQKLKIYGWKIADTITRSPLDGDGWAWSAALFRS